MNKFADQIEYNVHNILMLLKYLRYTRKDSTPIYGIATELHSLEIKSSVSKFNPYPINTLPERWKELRSKLEHTISVTKDIKRNLNIITGIELNIKEIERRLNNT